MNVSKEVLKLTGRFERADPATLKSLDEWAMWLEGILHGPCSIFVRDGESILLEGKQLVERLNGLRLEIYPDEHPPPHFHVKSPEINASFSIDDCRLLKGTVPPDSMKKIRHWHKHSKNKLVEVWNTTRPTNCTVGKFIETQIK